MLTETKVPVASSEAEQAIIQRYGLVRERRATAARIAQVEEAIQDTLKERFSTRFTAGAEAAAAFEQSARKLAEIAGEYTQLQQKMAGVLQQLE